MKQTFKKAISILLAAMMIFGSAAGIGSVDFSEFGIKAEAATYSGTCGAEAGWTFNDATGELTITGKGAMTSWKSISYVPWYNYNPQIKKITIGDKITSIGYRSFENAKNLTNVKFGNSLKTIENGAFYNTGIKSLTIPDSVTSVGQAAFESCKNLTSVTIGSGLTNIGESAFSNCSALKSVTFSENNKLTTIGEKVFYGCTSLTDIILPKTLTTLGSSSFSGCDSLTSISLPDSLTTIDFCAFNQCGRLISIAIPDNVTSIDDNAFWNCNSLTTVTFGENSKLTHIGERAFYNCLCLKKIVIPDSVKTIDMRAFEESGLNKITIGKGVESIGYEAFQGCSINDVYYTGKIEDWCKISLIDGLSNPVSKNFYIDNKLLTDLVIPDDATSIEKYVFYGFDCLKNVTIGNGVTSIGESAFGYCDNLENVVIGNSVTDIGQNSFTRCYKLENVTIGSSVKNIGKASFNWCSSLTKVTIPESVTSIDESAFEWCSNITSVTIGKGVTSIWDNAFAQCGKLAHICYTGSEEDWNNIHISSGNNAILNAKIHYNYDPAKHSHEYEKTITVKPTCTEKGTAINLCFCGNKATEDVPAKGHTEGDWKTEEYPTCLEEGKKSKYCTVCKALLKSEAIPATGHTEGYWDYEKEPTCTEDGKGECHCKKCGVIYQDKVVPAKGHTAGEWEVTEKPTTEAEGKKVKKCTVCGETVEEAAIAKIVFDDALINTPSETKVKYLESITVTMDESKIPEGGYVVWDADNLNCIIYQEGNSCVVYGYASGDTTLYATVYDADGNAILTDTQVVTANVNFLQKIIAFFKILFGLAQALPMEKTY